MLGTVAVLVAALASLALLNVLIEEPLPTGEGSGRGPGSGGSINFQPEPQPGSGQQDQGGESSGGDNPCTRIEPPVQAIAITSIVLSMLLWVVAVWWRQKRQTRVMNGWAIGALLVTLFAVTATFAWWLIHKICSLDVFDLQSCLDIAHSMRNVFFFFLLVAAGLIGYSIVRLRQGKPFWGLWSISGSVFVYLAILALVGWLVAEDMCDRRFNPEDFEDRLPDGEDPGNDPGGSDPGNDPGSDPGSSGGSPGFGGGGGGGGATGPPLPQVSPVALLVLLGMSALVTILVLAVRGRQEQARAAAMAMADIDGMGGMLKLFQQTDLHSNDAVVKTYRRFLDHCLLHGAAKKANETPREHAQRAAHVLDMPYDEMAPLIEAYTHIRLADSPLPEERRSIALAIVKMFRSPATRARATRRRRP